MGNGSSPRTVPHDRWPTLAEQPSSEDRRVDTTQTTGLDIQAQNPLTTNIQPVAEKNMASITGTAAYSVPRFLLPRLSWIGPTRSTSGTLQAAAFASISQPTPQRPGAPTMFHISRQSQRYALSKMPNQNLSIIQRNPSLHRSFHATAPRSRDHHFDTLKFVQRLQSEGFTEDQSVAMMKVLNDVIEESIQNLTRTMVLREDAARTTYTQKVDFAKLRSELLSADSTESNTTRAAHERLTNDITKLNSRLRDDISRTQASVRLDLNLEKGRIREEAAQQGLKIKETETKIEQEAAALREKLEQVKFQTLQWLMGVCTGFAALLLGAWRLLM
ncbi:putative DUF1640 domain-containing protein [Rosellinia necatrix]|uniref:Putative DUF1640 domain-containing protein n=1 Tax=Rosellinia necatrix TaxID=77044 RepID=A0A1W2TDV3_ROSNE|nr:putative DUF1640 domain-containing protein [Rosellinia necatrix]